MSEWRLITEDSSMTTHRLNAEGRLLHSLGAVSACGSHGDFVDRLHSFVRRSDAYRQLNRFHTFLLTVSCNFVGRASEMSHDRFAMNN